MIDGELTHAVLILRSALGPLEAVFEPVVRSLRTGTSGVPRGVFLVPPLWEKINLRNEPAGRSPIIPTFDEAVVREALLP